MEFIDFKSYYQRLEPVIEPGVLCLLRQCLHILGPKNGELEEKLAANCGAKHFIRFANDTAALLNNHLQNNKALYILQKRSTLIAAEQ